MRTAREDDFLKWVLDYTPTTAEFEEKAHHLEIDTITFLSEAINSKKNKSYFLLFLTFSFVIIWILAFLNAGFLPSIGPLAGIISVFMAYNKCKTHVYTLEFYQT